MTLLPGLPLRSLQLLQLVTATFVFFGGPAGRTATASPSGDEKKPSMKVIGHLEWPCSRHPQKGALVFRTRAELVAAWRADGGEKESALRIVPAGIEEGLTVAREVNFDREMVVAVFLGAATDHDGIKIERVVGEAGKVVVEYQRFPFYKGTAPIPASPCDVVIVEKIEGEVQFNELPPRPRLPRPIP